MSVNRELVGALNDIAGTNGLEAAGAANAASARVGEIEARITAIEQGGGGGGPSAGDSVVAETSYGQASSAGNATTYSRSNHTHGSPALSDAAPLALGSPAPGSASSPARSDHVHPTTGLALSSHSHSISEVTNLQSSLDGKSATSHNHDGTYAASSHTHAAGDVTSGTLNIARIPTGTSGTTVALGDHTHAGGSEAFPVGSVFISVVSTNPATLLGYGTWSAFAVGRTIVGIDAGQTEFDTVEETGGAKTHTLQTSEIPAHTHTQAVNSATTGGLSGYTPDTSTNTSTTSGYSTGSTGGGGAHNNLQPFIVVYMWKRSA